MRSPINLQWVHGGFRLPFGCVELCVVPTMGGNHRGVGETKEQTKCLSKLVKRLQVPKIRRIWCFCFTRNFGADEIDIDWYEIHIWWGYTHGIQGVAVFVCLIYHPLSSDSNLSCLRLPPSVGITGNGCDASRGSMKRQGLFMANWTTIIHTLLEINISHLGKRKIIFKYALSAGYVNSLEGNHSKLTVFHAIPDKEDFSRFFSGFSFRDSFC